VSFGGSFTTSVRYCCWHKEEHADVWRLRKWNFV
jgi:hypothetical protein